MPPSRRRAWHAPERRRLADVRWVPAIGVALPGGRDGAVKYTDWALGDFWGPIANETRAWLDHLVILFRAQQLADEDLIAFSRRFGELDRQARAFINDPKKNAIDRNSGRIALSKIFDWNRKEFERDGGTLTKYVARYRNDPDTAAWLASTGKTPEFLEYDWALNQR